MSWLLMCEVVPEEGSLPALPTSTLGKRDGTGVGTSQGEDLKKVRINRRKIKKKIGREKAERA